MRNSQQDIGLPTGAPERTIAKVLAGQKALVTGANSGIGQAAAIALGQAGADVVVNYVTGEDRSQAVVDAIRRSGAEAYAHKADVSQEDQVEDMFRHMVEQFGTVDILVNNAGLQRDAAFHEMTLAQWNTRPAEEPCRQPLPSSHWRVPEHNVAAEKSMLPPTEERR